MDKQPHKLVLHVGAAGYQSSLTLDGEELPNVTRVYITVDRWGHGSASISMEHLEIDADGEGFFRYEDREYYTPRR